ncbi:acetyl-CoA carboxylase biotin carboxyl carrier protein [Beduini massiliensis]|uniref:acetyl-CoA carboxylase biotin carboxyl carrier protein n=1 Tax=Beduini massiliensis TaxID=1585974 RepID=UPI003561820E
MKLDIIKELMDNFSDSDIHKMDVEFDDIKIKLEKEEVNRVAAQAPVMAMPSMPVSTPAAAPTPAVAVQEESVGGELVKAPLVGVFYSKNSPEAKAFVEVGSQVNAGDTLCIIEAMKVMNEIKAPISGTVTSILVKDEDLVEFDQVLMSIQG